MQHQHQSRQQHARLQGIEQQHQSHQHERRNDEDHPPGNRLFAHPKQTGRIERQGQRQQAVAQAVAEPQRRMAIDRVANVGHGVGQQPAAGQQ
ncbi:hypothetical protein D3C71_1413540 [compost metagenome]